MEGGSESGAGGRTRFCGWVGAGWALLGWRGKGWEAGGGVFGGVIETGRSAVPRQEVNPLTAPRPCRSRLAGHRKTERRIVSRATHGWENRIKTSRNTLRGRWGRGQKSKRSLNTQEDPGGKQAEPSDLLLGGLLCFASGIREWTTRGGGVTALSETRDSGRMARYLLRPMWAPKNKKRRKNPTQIAAKKYRHELEDARTRAEGSSTGTESGERGFKSWKGGCKKKEI